MPIREHKWLIQKQTMQPSKLPPPNKYIQQIQLIRTETDDLT